MYDLSKENIILAPVNGKIVEIEKVNDIVFNQKIIGNGLAIKPSDGTVLAPCNGTVECILSEKHAIFISCEDKTKILLHFGLDTFKMNGDGFNYNVCVNQKIKIGDLLATIDLDKIKKNKKDDIIIVVLPKNNNTNIVYKNSGNCIAAKTTLFRYQKY